MLRSLLHNVPAREVMATEFHTLRPEEPVAKALEHFYHGCQDDFPVVGDAGLEGILTRNRILASIHEKGLDTTVAEIMDQDLTAIEPDSPLDEVYKRLQSARKTAVAVVEAEQVKGMVCLDSISRYFMIRSALERPSVEGHL